MAVSEKMDINLTGATFTDELHTNVGASAFQLDHDWLWGGADLEIYTASGGGGTKLTEGAGNDYVLSVEDTYLTSESGKTVYGYIQIVNATYQTGNLYFNGKYIADSIEADDINELQNQIDSLGTALDRITKAGETIDGSVEVGDPVFYNVTKEIVDLCDIADWTDDAEITSSVNTSEFILSSALNLTKDTGANTTASLDKTLLVQIDFTSKTLTLYLYIDDAGTLADLTTLSCVTIRYGSDNSNYYQWLLDKADLAVGWNTITGLTSATADSTTGTPVIASMDYAYLALETNNAADTWVAGKVIMDHWFIESDKEWQLAAEGTPTPQGVYIGSNEVVLTGYTDQLSNLIPGQYYYMKSDGSKTITPGESYNNTKLGYSYSDSEFIVDIDIEGTNQTITPGQGAGGTIKGFLMGGDTGAFTAVIEDLIFSDETSQAIAATLDTAKTDIYGVSSSTKGYCLGGDTGGGVTAVIEDLIFSDETSQAIAATLDTAKRGGSGVFSSLKGYCLGGNTGAVTTVIEDIIFSNETSQAIAATLDTAKYIGAGISSPAKGYIMGGFDAAETAVIEDIIFSNETSQAIAATLDTACSRPAGTYSSVKGYAMGGQIAGPGYITSIEDLIFSDETSQAIAAIISDSRCFGGQSISSLSKGYAMGGNDAAKKTTIDSLIFSAETCGAIAATLDTAKTEGAGVQY